MNILIVTNTFTPHVGGVARSVEAFTAEYRRRGHRVLVLAPEFPDMEEDATDVIRIPAIQNFNASDFSVVLPLHPSLSEEVDDFNPDVVHSQHPFLLGSTAVRLARHRKLPLVFTHHTLYEQYTHYVPGDSPALKRFTIELATRYANLCDQVFAPSESIRDIIRERGVEKPIEVVPTGVQPERFARGDRTFFRAAHDIPDDAFVVGHLGRLAPEKNLEFLARAVLRFLADHRDAMFLVVGAGPSENAIRKLFSEAGLADRLRIAGVLEKQALANALHAMDVFAFASHSETQGMVLTEAMAAGLPVIALDASGVREVVRDRNNGRLLRDETPQSFAAALQWAQALAPEHFEELKRGALATAHDFSLSRSADSALACYESLVSETPDGHVPDETPWEDAMAAIRTEWELLKNVAVASDAALGTRLFIERES